MDGLHDDTGDGSMMCTEHPFKNNTPAGGICAFCLQEKLGKLVSSSFPIAVFPSSSSSSPSFRSDIGSVSGSITTTTTTNVGSNIKATTNELHYHQHHHHHHHLHSTRFRVLYLLGQKKKKNDQINVVGVNTHNDNNKNLIFKRSKSYVTPRRNDKESLNNKRGFWSFLHPHSSKNTLQKHIPSNSLSASVASTFPENETSPNHATSDQKVSRSRSVGCGSRSFSGDFFERISTFGDCTLRRVESNREGKNTTKVSGSSSTIHERARCGGLFSGFMITSSSSSSSSSSNWVGSNCNEGSRGNATGKVTSRQQHSRSKSWGWALASPMRAFSKPTLTSASVKNNPSPNLGAIPSLLYVRS